jgi:hypothetical protein
MNDVVPSLKKDFPIIFPLLPEPQKQLLRPLPLPEARENSVHISLFFHCNQNLNATIHIEQTVAVVVSS